MSRESVPMGPLPPTNEEIENEKREKEERERRQRVEEERREEEEQKKRNEMRKRLFETQDHVELTKEKLLEKVESRLPQQNKLEPLFTIRWKIT